MSQEYLEILKKTAKKYSQSNKASLQNGIKNLFATYSPQSLLKRAIIRQNWGFAPEGYVVSVTDGCNLKCKYCYYRASPQNKSKTIDFNKLDIIFNEMKRHFGIKFVTITGGETTFCLHKLAARRQDITFFVYTNGTLLTKKFCRELEALGNVIIALTLVADKTVHDKIRGNGNYEQVMAAVNNLRQSSLIWGFSLTESRINYEEIVSGNLLGKLLYMQPHFFRMIPFMPVGRSADKLTLTKKEFKQIGIVIKSQKNKCGVIIHDYINDTSLGIPCMAGGTRNFFITENLEVSPCVFMDIFTPIEFTDKYSNLITIIKNHHYFQNARKLASIYKNCIILEHPIWRQEIANS